MISTLPQSDCFRTSPLRGLPADSRVDMETRTIYGAKAMQFGPLVDGDVRPWKVDGVTLSQLAKLINDRPSGVKMRFAHPNMSRDGMGSHVGRASNARVIGEGSDQYVSIDAKIGAANKAKADHVLDMAANYPEDFGLSIAPVRDEQAMSKIEPDEDGLIPIRIKSLRAIDFVDEPAATRGGLFSLDSDSVADLPAQATELLDTFFGDAPADVIRSRFAEFLSTYLTNRGENEMAQQAESPKPANEQPAPIQTTAQMSTEANAAQQETARAELSRRAEITALCKLAKISDENRDLMLSAGFSRAEAQEWLKSSGLFAANSPPVSEGAASIEQPKDPHAEFAAEYEQQAATFTAMGISKEQYIASRAKG